MFEACSLVKHACVLNTVVASGCTSRTMLMFTGLAAMMHDSDKYGRRNVIVLCHGGLKYAGISTLTVDVYSTEHWASTRFDCFKFGRSQI